MPQREDCQLRQMRLEDRERIHAWRNSDRIRSVMLSQDFISLDDHTAWFDRTLKDPSSCYLIFELRRRPVGLINFPRIHPQTRSCQWGFYIGEDNTPKGTGSAMGFLGLDYAFKVLPLDDIIGVVLMKNTPGLRLHERLKFERQGELVLGGPEKAVRCQTIRFRMTKPRWLENRDALKGLLFQAAPDNTNRKSEG